jgi:hypothetical protein
MIEKGDKVRVVHVAPWVYPNNYPNDAESQARQREMELDFAACLGRTFKVKDVAETLNHDRKIVLYQLHIGHVRGQYTNRKAAWISIWVEDNEIEPIKKRASKRDK